jgi:hypothetical protein
MLTMPLDVERDTDRLMAGAYHVPWMRQVKRWRGLLICFAFDHDFASDHQFAHVVPAFRVCNGRWAEGVA